MKIKKLLFFITLTMLFSIDMNAQRRKIKEPDRKSKIEQPRKNSDSEKDKSKDVQEFKKDEEDYFEKYTPPKNVLKLNLIEAFEGSLPLHYERAINARLSIELGLGITFTSPAFTYAKDKIFGNTDFDGFQRGKTGSVFRIDVRYYLNGKYMDAPEGVFLALGYQLQKFKFYGTPYISTPSGPSQIPIGLNQETTITNNDLIRIMGGVKGELRNNFAWEFYVGVGLRNKIFEGWTVDNLGLPTLEPSSTYIPSIIVGLKTCFGF
jgi:hypothetical protein